MTTPTFRAFLTIIHLCALPAGAAVDLAAFSTSAGTLTPPFDSAITQYTASVATPSIAVKPTVADLTASVRVNGITVNSGDFSSPIDLAVGSNIISTVVTDPDGITTKTYTLSVTRLSNNANLAALSTSVGTLSPSFDSATTTYTASVATPSITLKPTVADTGAAVTVNGITVTSGDFSSPIDLAVGSNIISTVVTARDGITTKTYTLSVTRLSNNANLAALSTSVGTLSPSFSSVVFGYIASVSNATTSITLKPTVADTGAAVTVNGITVTSGDFSSPIDLAVGSNIISAVVTAQDGITTKTYTLSVTRLSNNANLAALWPSSGTLNPGFGSATAGYTLTVPFAVNNLRLAPVVADNTAAVRINGGSVNTGSFSDAVLLSVGSNIISAVVTAQDGIATKTYQVMVTRLGADAVNSTSVVAWGAGATSTNIEPNYGQSVIPAGLNGVTAAISGGLYHSVAMKNDGSVVAWGYNGYSQTTVPSGLTTVTAVATLPANPAGTVNTLSITVSTAVSNSIIVGMVVTGPPGTVGTGATVLGKSTVSGVTSLQLSVPNAVRAAETSASITLSPFSPVIAVSAGAFHTLALKSNGSVLAWGAGTSTPSSPAVAPQFGQSIIPLGLSTLTGVAATIPANPTGTTHTVTLSAANTGIVPGMTVTGPGLTVGSGAKVLSVAGTTITLTVPNVNTVLTPASLTFSSGVVAIAAGYYHSVALKADGSVVAWGDNTAGQTTVPAGLQTLSTITSLPANPNPPGTVNTITLVSNNANIIPDMWVAGQSGTVGTGAKILSKSVTNPPVLTLSVANAANTNAGATPVPLLFLPGTGVVAIAAGHEHTVALKSDGTMVAWGRNLDGQTDGLATVTAAATLPAYTGTPVYTVTLAAANAGIVPGMLVTGLNETVGAGASVVSKDVSGLVLTLTVPNANTAPVSGTPLIFSPVVKAIVIAAGGDNSFALKNDTTVAAWGDNFNGQTNIPAGLSGVTAITAAGDHAIALKVDGTVMAWGKIWNGAAFVNETVPVGLHGVSAIAAGAYHTLALALTQPPVITTQPAGMTVNQGGSATFSVIGAGTPPLSYQWRGNGADLTNTANISGAASATLTLTNVQPADAANYSVVVTDASGSVTSAAAILTVIAMTPDAVTAWGAGASNTNVEPEYGQSVIPAGLAGMTQNVSAGLYHSVALKTDGSVVAWGYNGYGQATVPSGLATVSAVATFPANPAGTVKTVSITVSTAVSTSIFPGMVVTGPPGTLGAGATVVSKSTVSGVTTLTFSVTNAVSTAAVDATITLSPAFPVTAIAAGAHHTLALKSDGSVVAWGAGTSSTATVGTVHQTQSYVPPGLTTLSGVAATIPRNDTGLVNTITLAAANVNIVPGMAVTGPGLTVGSGAKVLSVSGTTVTLSVPNANSVMIPAASSLLRFHSGVVAIAAGYYHSVALRNDGSVVAWGDNSEGQSTVPSGMSLISAVALLSPNPAPGTVHHMTLGTYNANVAPDMMVTGPFGSVGAGASIVTRLNATPSFLTLSTPNAINSLATATLMPFVFTPVERVVAIAAGFDHTLALRSDGTVVAWGRNVEGQTVGVAPFTAGATLPGIPIMASASLAFPATSTVTLAAADAAIVPGMMVTGADGTVAAGAMVVTNVGTTVTLSVPNVNTAVLAVAALTFSANPLSNNTITLAAANPAIIPGMLVSGPSATVGVGATVVSKDPTGLILTLSSRNAYGGTANSAATTLTFSSAVQATAIAAGGDTSYVLKADGTVAAWGDNVNGQTDIPAGLSGVTAIAANGNHAVALKSGGSVVTWGEIWNGYAYVNETVPTGLTGVTAIAAGGFHTLAVIGGPAITIGSHPANRTNIIGTTATFAVTATGTAPLNYQWQKNGVNLTNSGGVSGTTTATLTLANVQAGDASNYSVVVSDTYGSITSAAATLTVTNDPLPDALDRTDLVWTTGGDAPWLAQTTSTHDGIDAARSGAITGGQESWLQTTLIGPGTLGYWWMVSSEDTWDWLEFYLDGVLQSGRISGESGWRQRSITIPSGSHTVRWRYMKDAWDNSGRDAGWLDAVSFVADSPLPQITTQPENRLNLASSTATFSVTATSPTPLIYQWFKNDTYLSDGGNITGATTATLTLANVHLTDVASYTVFVSNAFGSATSTAATLTLEPPLVTTGSASDITRTTASLSGTVNPNGLTTTARLEYGLTATYGSKARVTLVPDNGIVTQIVSVGLSGLQPGTIYHYRFTATSGSGTTPGADMTFETPSSGIPITPAELLPPKITIAGGNLNFTIAPSVLGRIYQLQQSDTLAADTWQNLGQVRVGDGNPLVITTPRESAAPRRFYRIALGN